MLTGTSLVLLIGLAGLFGLWLDATRVRERANRAVRRLCEEASVQLLDGTVALDYMRLARAPQGGITLLRVFRFEFTEDGRTRREGAVTFRGARREHVYMALPEPTVVPGEEDRIEHGSAAGAPAAGLPARSDLGDPDDQR
mgnify:CR=1 FL=1